MAFGILAPILATTIGVMENCDEVPAANFSACSSMLSPLCSPCPYWGFTQARSRNVDPCDESTLLPALRRWVPNTAANTHVSATSRLRPAPQACESYNSQTQRYRNLYRSFAGVCHDGHIEMPICSGQILDFTTWRIGESCPRTRKLPRRALALWETNAVLRSRCESMVILFVILTSVGNDIAATTCASCRLA